ncbi:fimbrillin family protein [Pedobacter aquatilis]|uniref:fimbrillin family protein n=1 Tax=Pedobacter aquatilis TaxID=351343 RepID=UPI00292D6157|nr:fimbrillin family protein [Pedobacter aquatilis]
MKIKNLQIISLTMLAFLGTACRKDKAPETPNEIRTAVQFSSAINGQIKTKAADNSWDANDAIGVFMKTGTGLANTSASNKSYTTTGDGQFKASATEQTIYYPENGSSVDFIAYYPFKQSLVNNTYAVDVNNQTTQSAIDLLYANNANGLSKTNTNANLIFTHQLSKVEITVKAGTGVTDLNGLGVNVSGVKSLASFDLATGTLSGQTQVANVVAKTSIKNSLTVAEAILIPTTDETGTKVIFSIGTKTYTWTLPAGSKFESGKKYTYEVELKGEGTTTPGIATAIKATITNWNDVPSGSYSLEQETVTTTPPTLSGYMEMPLITTDENTVFVSHDFPGRTNVRNYSMLYDKKYKMAYWVAYPLHASYIGSSGRTDAWAFDPKIAQSSQVDLSSSFGGGYDRGHQIPSGDRTATRELNATTFYYSNMTAQVSSMNQGIWNNLEQQVRTWTAQSDTLYVITGAAIKTATDQNITYSKGSAIPKYYYKALAMKKGDTYYTIGFRIDNQIIPSGNNYNTYRVTVSDLEKETGYTFFPKLNNAVKQTIDSTIWK